MGSVESLTNVKKIVENINEPVVVVVSALGGITDRLIRTSQLAVAGDDNYRNEFEVLQYRNIKDVQEITPLRGYSSLYNAFLKSQSTPGSDADAGDRYFNEWYQAQGK